MEYLDFGTPISFGYTAQYLPKKSVTRRDWKDSHAAKFTKAFERATTDGKKLRVPAIDKAYHAGGKQIGWLILSEVPYKEALKNMPHADLIAEGGMCATVKEFAAKYFKGDLEKKVWVVGFSFQPLEPIESLIEEESHNPVPEPIQISPTKSQTLQTLTSSKSDEHFTPAPIIEAAREVMDCIDLDPMSCEAANKTVKAAKFYNKEADGLAQPWSGKVWLNPAFSLANEAVGKLLYSYLTGTVSEALLLIKAAPDTARHQSLAALPFCEWRGRIKFVAKGNSQPAPFAVFIFYLGKNFGRFKEVFSEFGNIRLGQTQVEELERDRRELLAQVAELQMQLAKKSEFSNTAGELDMTDWLNHDLAEQIGIAKSRLTELEIDREVLPEDLYIRQRTEWQAKLECWRYTERAIAKINTRFTPEYEAIINREHPTIESESDYTPDFAPNKLIESSPETGNLLVRIDQYHHTTAGWIAKCNVRISQRVARGSEFLITANELFKDFHPWLQKKAEILPQYSLGSIRTAKGLKNHFKGLKLPPAPRPETTEVKAPDGSIWQAYRDGWNERAAIKWRCEVLPDGFSRSPRIDTKNDRVESVALAKSFY